ncbi:MAG TPA: SCO family protein [Solirubrobacteraceae bacterium]
MPPSLLRTRAHAALLASALALAGAVSLGGCGGGSASSSTAALVSAASGSGGFDGAALPPGIHAPPFALRDQNGARVSLSAYRGKVVVLAFLSSTCGSTCQLIAQQIRGGLDELSTAPPVLVVSADPAADTPAHVSRFLRHVSLSGRVRWLSATAAALRPIWRAFRVRPVSAGPAAFASSASIYLIDRNGFERVIFQLEQLTPEALSHDVRKLQP